MGSSFRFFACIGTMNPGVAASRQSAAIRGNNSRRRSAETPLRGDGSWKAPFRFSAYIGTMNRPLTRPSGTLSPLGGGEGGVRGSVHGERTPPKIGRELEP